MIYKGTRTERGCVVTVDGRPLDPRNKVRNHSPDGFEWGYAGSGPAQLALAILCAHYAVPPSAREPGMLEVGSPGFNDTPIGKALYAYQRFKALCVQHLPRDGWELHGGHVKAFLKAIQEERPESPYLVV